MLPDATPLHIGVSNAALLAGKTFDAQVNPLILQI